ncbi:MAG: enterotoxin [Acidobacteriota bacterium]|nr:enterotoxin [Acidobacteriota bacterium]
MPRFSSIASFAALILSTAALPAQTAHVTSSGGSIANDHVALEWTARENHPLSLSLQGLKSTVSLGSPFALVIHNRGIVTAADLVPRRGPQIEQLTPNPNASRYAERVPGVAVRYEFADPEHQFTAEWSVVLREGSSYARQSLTITTGDQSVPIDDIRLIDLQSPSSDPTALTVSGTVQGSPLVLQQPNADFYLGFEQPLSTSSVVQGRGVSELASAVPLGAHQSATYSSVIGVAQPRQLRRDFLAYLERERAHPYRTFLHYNSWFDIGFFTPYTQQDALTRIHEIGEELHVKRGVTLDSYLFDDGWDDHNDLWRIRPDFKDGFTPLQKAAAEYGTHIGIWLSPWGGYGPAKKERLATAKRDGFETMNGGLALSGPKYYARFHEAVTGLVKKYGVNQFKLDGTGNVDTVVKGSQFSSDFDAAIHLIHDVRELKPDIYINLTTGTWPSPFWLMYADSIWRGGDDTSQEGVGTMREQWITYRDASTYNEVVKRGPLYPLNSLMLHGIVFAQKAPHLSTDPGNDFSNEVHSYFGEGTQLQELYITPSLLSNANWDTLAEAAKWSRRNADTLKDTHWVGGDPRWLQVYGWASWSPKKGILTLRNPSNKPQSITLDVARIFELPAGAPTHYRAHSPWAADADQPPMYLTAGEPYTFQLAPFQVLTLEAQPQ